MKRKISTVILSCLTCIGILAYSALPVHAFSLGACSHPNFATSFDPVPTGGCYYSESGHDVEYGIGHTCLKCGYEYYTDTYFRFENHELGDPVIVLLEDGTAEVRYYCTFDGCPWYGVYE